MNKTAQSMHALDAVLHAALGQARTVRHAGEQGGQAEDAWRDFLGARLPARYAVARGEIFDADGRHSEAQDIVLYDRQYSPLVFGTDAPKVVAEAVYGVLEVKPDLTAAHFDYARNKAVSARSLNRTSVPIYHAGGRQDPKPPVRQLAGLVADASGWTADTTPDHVRAQLEAHTNADDPAALDLVYTDGLAASHLIDPERGERDLRIHAGTGSMAWFLIELLRGLSHLGTVAAIDYAAYRDTISST